MLWKFIKEKMLSNPKQLMCEENSSFSYEEAVIYAEVLSEKIRSESRVCILCSSEMFSALGVMACFAAEVTAIPLSMRYGKEHCCRIMEQICPDALITDIRGSLEVVYLERSDKTVPDECALMLFTSGSTGKPKGVMLSEKNLLCNALDICEYFKIDSSDKLLISRPIYHGAVLTGELLVSLIKGAKICFCSGKFDPQRMLRLIEKEKITALCATPTVFSVISRMAGKYDVSSVKTIVVSGEKLSSAVAESIAKAFGGAAKYHVYGLTEASPRVSYLPPELFSEKHGSVGFPLRSVSVKIVSDNGQPAIPGETGVLWVRGDNVMLGYFDDPEQSARVLRDGWLCTGDAAYIDKDGMLYIKGRSDDLIIRAGMNIYPAEIEGVIEEDSRVKEVVAFPIYFDDGACEIGMKIAGDFSDVSEVRELCINTLPLYAVPVQIELVDALEKTATGKKTKHKQKGIQNENI